MKPPIIVRSEQLVKFSGVGASLLIVGSLGVYVALPAVVVTVALGRPWSLIGPVGIAVVLAYPVARTLRIGLEVGPERVVIVNYFRRYAPTWPEIELVGIGAGSSLAAWGDGINVRLRSGREILCQASIDSKGKRDQMLAAFQRFGERWNVPVRRAPP